MKIGIDTSPLRTGHATRGIGNYTKNLLIWLKKSKTENIMIEEFKPGSSYDLIHYPYFDLFNLSLPFYSKSGIIVTIHDVIPLLYPKQYPPGIKGSFKYHIQKLLLKKVKSVITDSQTSKNDIVKYLSYPPDKIYPIPLGIENQFRNILNPQLLSFVRKKYHLPAEFVLYVGDVNYNKNLLNLAEAVLKTPVSLVIVGKQAGSVEDFDEKHQENQPWVTFLKQYSHNRRIIRTGFIPSEDIPAIYNLASVFCYPSLYEGFGLPILEAMACGCPVVCSNTPALMEITDEAALSVNPYSVEEIANKLNQILTDHRLKKQLITNGFLNIKRFSWEKYARETIKVYQGIG